MRFKPDDVLLIPHDGGTDYVPFRNIMAIRENDVTEVMGLCYVIELTNGKVLVIDDPDQAVILYRQLHSEEIA